MMRVSGKGAALGALALSTLIGCLLEGDKSAKRGSEVENEIHGVLVAVNGDPVQGAKVKAVPVAGTLAKRSSAAADSDSVVTDKDGKYSLQGLEPGTYNLFGDYQSGELVVLIPGVDHTDTSEPKDQGVDTLRAPGRIRGRVLLGEGGKPGVFAYVPGTSYLAISDDSGRFEIGGVPQGAHRVDYSVQGFVIEPDTGVRVLSGKTTVLPEKRLAYDPALPPPAPTGFKAVYDTLGQRVLLTWNPVAVSDLDGYLVYRDDPAFPDPQFVRGGFTRDTVFVDTTFIVPSGLGGVGLSYRLRSRDRELNQSQLFSAPAQVEAVSRQWVVTQSSLAATGLRDGAASPNDTIRFVFSYTNPTRRIRRIEWRLQGNPQPLRVSLDSSSSGQDSLTWISGQPGQADLVVKAFDDAGDVWMSSMSIPVVHDLPVADAGMDTVVSLGDEVRLHGSAGDTRGRIVKMEWDIGGTGDFRPAGKDTSIQAPRTETAAFAIVLRATDDDSGVGLDTMHVQVLLDAPQAKAGPDTTVSVGDSVHLHGMGTDGFGRIVKWEWVIGATGAYLPTPSGKYSFKVGDSPTAILCILRVTDDDGVASTDSVLVHVIADAPVADAGRDMSASIGDTVTLTGRSNDGFGRVISYAWDLGASGTFVPGSPETTFTLPSRPQAGFLAVLRVTDDDGNQGLDTLRIEVQLDPPQAKASYPEGIYFTGDSVRLTSAGSRDVFGTLVKREWSIGTDTTFGDSGMEAIFALPSAAGDIPVVLRVTDDDGVIDMDTVVVKANATGAKNWFPAGTSLGSWIRSVYGHQVVEFKGKLWMLGGYENPFVLNSVDGISWSPVGESPWGGWDPTYLTVTVFNDQIWAIGGWNGGVHEPLNGVWRSPDGVSWTRVENTPVGSLGAHATLVFNDALIVIGGSRGNPVDSVWISPDGENWTGYSTSATLGAREYHSAVVHGGKIFLVCGDDGFNGTIPGAVWTSTDAKSWTKILGGINAPFPQPFAAPMVSARGRLWLYLDQHMYSSVDGLIWEKTAGVLSRPRYNPAMVDFRDRLWLIGGGTVGDSGPPDIWFTK